MSDRITDEAERNFVLLGISEAFLAMGDYDSAENSADQIFSAQEKSIAFQAIVKVFITQQQFEKAIEYIYKISEIDSTRLDRTSLETFSKLSLHAATSMTYKSCSPRFQKIGKITLAGASQPPSSNRGCRCISVLYHGHCR